MKIHGWIKNYPCSWFYLRKKHSCPACGEILERKQREKIVNSFSKEAKNYDFSVGGIYPVGNIKFITFYFGCPNCEAKYEILELKQIQKKKKC